MTKKQNVDFNKYKKNPRLLKPSMETALGPEGGLNPILVAVNKSDQLRFEIRDRRFNVYYGGGNLLLVDGRKRTWSLHFDKRYYEGGALKQPSLPKQFSTLGDSQEWVNAIPTLMKAMETWWTRHPKDERAHCQKMAAVNSAINGLPQTDYVVLDLEYQWAQRRFDLIAAKRKSIDTGSSGWFEPDLVFVEVKSEYKSCSGGSGLYDHASDYRDIVLAQNGKCVQNIKQEFENLIAQKKRLGLLHKAFPFQRFSAAPPELLFVLIDLKLNDHSLTKPISQVRAMSIALGSSGRIRFMPLQSPRYEMF